MGAVLYKTHLSLLKLTDDKGYKDAHFRCECPGERLTSSRKHKVHVLVQAAFGCPRPSPIHTINHMGGNKKDNRADQLEWTTPLKQILLAHATGLVGPRRKRRHHDADLPGEQWRPAPSTLFRFDDTVPPHLVSSKGRLRSGDGLLHNQWVDAKGYHACRLSAGSERRMFLVHRLLALAFLPNPQSLSVVDHINDDPGDNRLCNLQWLSVAENSIKANGKTALQIDLASGAIL
jgi:hypothetical protein